VLLHDNAAATHLFRIAQEAINNAVKHGRATKIVVRLAADEQSTTLRVTDNGVGLRKPKPDHTGMGLRIMKYRSDMIGGTLAIQPAQDRGTSVACTFPRQL